MGPTAKPKIRRRRSSASTTATKVCWQKGWRIHLGKTTDQVQRLGLEHHPRSLQQVLVPWKVPTANLHQFGEQGRDPAITSLGLATYIAGEGREGDGLNSDEARTTGTTHSNQTHRQAGGLFSGKHFFPGPRPMFKSPRSWLATSQGVTSS